MDGSEQLDDLLTRLRRRLALAVLAGELCRWAGGLLVAGGVAALLLRSLFGLEPALAAWAFAPLVLAPPIAWERARGRIPERAALATWLDRRAGGSGALVTAFETGPGAWSRRPARAELDPPRLRVRLLAGRLLPGALFAALALLVPVPAAQPRSPDLLALRLALDLREKLTALTESVTLEERVAHELEQRLARHELEIEQGAGGEAPLEAADGLRERMESLAREAAGSAQRARERLAAAREASAPNAVGQSAEGQSAAREALEAALEALREGGLERHLAGGLAELAAGLGQEGELPAGLDLDPQALARLGEELDSALARVLAGLERGGLLDLEKLRRSDELRPLSELLARLHTCDEACRQGGT